MAFMQSIRPATNKVVTVPAPTGGLNARDSLANMPETDALVLNNWWPQPYGLQARPGFEVWVDDLDGTVGTLATWADSDGTSKLLAWSGDGAGDFGVYDVSTRQVPGDPPRTPLVDGLSSAYWQTVQTVNTAGAHLFAVNGADSGLLYDSTGFHDILYDAGPAPVTPVDYTWYGLDSTTVVQLTSHQGRLWAVQKDSAVGWYLPTDALWGEFKSFDFGALFSKGGYITFMTTWTIDDGNGAEDHLVVVSSEGQAAVYGGTNPDDPTKWQLVGVYYVGEPVLSRRGYYKVGGDLIILTQRGLTSMAAQLVSTKVNEAANALASDKVQLLISSLVGAARGVGDWELYYNPSKNVFLINVPGVTAGGARQLASNVVTALCPWCFFVGMDAVTWETYENDMFYGDNNGRVLRAWTGFQDNVGLDGTGGYGVQTQVQQAYSYLGSMAVQKQVGMYRPNFLVAAPIRYASIIEYDFAIRPLDIPTAAPPGASGSLWDTALWDQGQWSGGVVPDRLWHSAAGIGVAASIRMAMQSQNETLWVGTDYSYKVGTLL